MNVQGNSPGAPFTKKKEKRTVQVTSNCYFIMNNACHIKPTKQKRVTYTKHYQEKKGHNKKSTCPEYVTPMLVRFGVCVPVLENTHGWRGENVCFHRTPNWHDLHL